MHHCNFNNFTFFSHFILKEVTFTGSKFREFRAISRKLKKSFLKLITKKKVQKHRFVCMRLLLYRLQTTVESNFRDSTKSRKLILTKYFLRSQFAKINSLKTIINISFYICAVVKYCKQQRQKCFQLRCNVWLYMKVLKSLIRTVGFAFFYQ